MILTLILNISLSALACALLAAIVSLVFWLDGADDQDGGNWHQRITPPRPRSPTGPRGSRSAERTFLRRHPSPWHGTARRGQCPVCTAAGLDPLKVPVRRCSR